MNGVIFKSLHNSTIGVDVLNVQKNILPTAVRFTQQVPGLSGTQDFGNDTYGEISHRVICYCKLSDSVTVERDLRGWLYNDGEYYDLIFDEEPDRKYRAKVVEQFDRVVNKSTVEYTITFLCNPPYSFLLDNTPITPADEEARLLWDTMTLNEAGTQYIQTLSSDGTIRFTVGGSLPVNPVIKIYGYIASGFKMTYGAQAWQYDADLLYDGIIIDCDNETVLRASDGANLYGNVNEIYDDYFEIDTGQEFIDITGVTGAFPNDLTIAIEFTPIGG